MDTHGLWMAKVRGVRHDDDGACFVVDLLVDGAPARASGVAVGAGFAF